MPRNEETNLQARMLAEVSALRLPSRPVLMRNNNGVAVYTDKYGSQRHVKYGLGTGSSDLIGWRQVLITPEMVGKTIAQFVGWESKTEDGDEEEEQRKFRDGVNAVGGLAFVARSSKEAVEYLRREF